MLKTANCSLQWGSVCGDGRGEKNPQNSQKWLVLLSELWGSRLEGAIQGTLTVDATFLFIQKEKEKKQFWWHKMIKWMELIIPILCIIAVFKFRGVPCWLLCTLPSSCNSINESVLTERLKRERWCLQKKILPSIFYVRISAKSLQRGVGDKGQELGASAMTSFVIWSGHLLVIKNKRPKREASEAWQLARTRPLTTC